MAPEPDLMIVTLLVGPGVDGRPVTEDLGAFQRLVTQNLDRVPNAGIGLNLVFDLAGLGALSAFSGPKFVRFDKRRQRVTIAVAVPSDLSARTSTAFIRGQTAEALLLAEGYLQRKKLPGDIRNVREVLQRAFDALPPDPLSEEQRFREVEHRRASPNEPTQTVAELDATGRELRKVDIYADGAMDYAVRSIETGTTRLNSRLPGSADGVRLIGPATFASIWQRAIGQERPRGSITVRDTGTDHGS